VRRERMIIFIGVVTLIFSGLVALYTSKVAHYTKEVARCTREYTTETRRLWEVTKNSYFAKAIADHLFEQYVHRIGGVPPYLAKLGLDVTRKEILKALENDCYRLTLDQLLPGVPLPGVPEIEEKIIKKLEKEGYKFKQE